MAGAAGTIPATSAALAHVQTSLPSTAVTAASEESTLGWPGPTNTGVPKGTSLTVVSGDLTVSDAGTVIDARDVRGVIHVNAPNVTITRTRALGGIQNNSANLVIRDTEVGPRKGKGGDVGVGDGGYTCIRCNVHNFSDGFRTGGGRNVAIVESWVHDLHLGPRDHNDGIQRFARGKASDDVIRHNRIDCRGCSTSAIFYADNWRGTVRIDDNLLAGGGYTLRIHESGSASITNNQFVRNSYDQDTHDLQFAHVVEWSGNTFSQTARPIPE